MIQILLAILFKSIGTWLIIGVICWIIPMTRACIFYNRKFTLTDFIMLFIVTLNGPISLYKLLKVIHNDRKIKKGRKEWKDKHI